MPALLETIVKSLKSGRSRTALIKVFGTPEKPKPPTRIIEFPLRSLMASCALGTILLIAHCVGVVEKFRRPRLDARNSKGAVLTAFMVNNSNT